VARGVAGITIEADGLSVDGPQGPVFSGVSLHAAAGSLVAVAGSGGSGRTSLLLTLAGRMRPTAGTARVDGHPLPAQAGAVRRLVTVAQAGGAAELQEGWRVSEAIGLRGVLRGLAIGAREAAAALEACGLDPAPDALVRELSSAQRTRLAIALAWLEDPPGVVVDDVDRGADRTEERAIWDVLRALSQRGATIVAATTDAGVARGVADQVVAL
jgi:ABC-type multidrug transport system ATPase subunit